MKIKYLSYSQACSISDHYQYLIGQAFDDHHTIAMVGPAPYSPILQWQFVQSVLVEGATNYLLHERNPSGRYDVIVVAKAPGTGLLVEDLRSYLDGRGISFDPKLYHGILPTLVPLVTLKQILE